MRFKRTNIGRWNTFVRPKQIANLGPADTEWHYDCYGRTDGSSLGLGKGTEWQPHGSV